MRKFKYSLLAGLPFCLAISSDVVAATQAYTLEQVMVFSRHGLRAPLSSPSSALGKVTPDQWPQWDTPSSYLTTRGGALESYFGHYFSEWLVDNKLLASDTCPTDKDVYFYANSLQRTIATAQFFSVGAFPGCIVPVHHKEKLGTMDATFNPIITDNSEDFKQRAIASIQERAGDGGLDGLNNRLKTSYQDMMQVINYTQSANCQQDKQCDLTTLPSSVKIVAGEEPGVTGPLKMGTSIADAFILQYYEGSPLSSVAWGKIKTDQQFEKLVAIKEYYNSVVFSAPVVAKEVSAKLVKYLSDVFTDSADKAKFTFLAGHDSNVASLFSALKVKPYQLPNQFETTPIGGKVVFERWKDASGKDLMKIEYVYQSTDQIKGLQELNRQKPPQRTVLELEGCPIDAQGFCSFDKFKTVLQDVLNN
ncbi:bifunctional glucose-1-phosphatase/inositol phosphatase [Biostraticola tofi]|uniref:Glucose-1-phosphatase n=1 Tax=Biostraticola tofi TaxID=466109 RepID=A0A4R3Z1P8_9GAMM|nr:bifunctional glucose-1-phosphatase/inositol phosphatase [Biostraticola tofi]TCV98148.1 glucose-1-phosphatase [Biostraticola tofi]